MIVVFLKAWIFLAWGLAIFCLRHGDGVFRLFKTDPDPPWFARWVGLTELSLHRDPMIPRVTQRPWWFFLQNDDQAEAYYSFLLMLGVWTAVQWLAEVLGWAAAKVGVPEGPAKAVWMAVFAILGGAQLLYLRRYRAQVERDRELAELLKQETGL